jgi:hypothetical protein
MAWSFERNFSKHYTTALVFGLCNVVTPMFTDWAPVWIVLLYLYNDSCEFNAVDGEFIVTYKSRSFKIKFTQFLMIFLSALRLATIFNIFDERNFSFLWASKEIAGMFSMFTEIYYNYSKGLLVALLTGSFWIGLTGTKEK